MVFLGGFHAAVHHGHVIVREHLFDLFKSLFQGVQVEFLVLLDEGIDDICLTAFLQLLAHKLVHLETVRFMLQDRGNRFASRRQFINDRYVQIAIDRHRQCPRNGRCRHHEYMRRRGAVFAPQSGSLSHTKAVLLVDDSQSQVAELHRVLDEGMGANEYLQLATHQCLVNSCALTLTGRARQESHLDTDSVGQRPDSFQMLTSQYFGGCHDAGLVSIIQGNQCGHESDNRLTATHISLQEAVHLLSAAHVMAHLADNTLLRPGKRKLQNVVVKAVEISAHVSENVSHQTAAAAFYIMQDVELQEKQLFELESQLRPLQCLLVGRHMDVPQRISKRHEAVTLQQLGWQRLADVLHRLSIQQVEHKLVYCP